MGTCNIDHTQEDVLKKLQSQESHLPTDSVRKLYTFLGENPTQDTLNEVFHLLKKYDLATEEEKKERDRKLEQIIN